MIALGLSVAALAALVAAPVVAEAAPMGLLRTRLADTPLGRFVSGQIGHLLVLRSKLNVTAEQREQIVAIVQSHRAEPRVTGDVLQRDPSGPRVDEGGVVVVEAVRRVTGNQAPAFHPGQRGRQQFGIVARRVDAGVGQGCRSGLDGLPEAVHAC